MIQKTKTVFDKITPEQSKATVPFSMAARRFFNEGQRTGITSKLSRSLDLYMLRNDESDTEYLTPEQADSLYPSSQPRTQKIKESVAKYEHNLYLVEQSESEFSEQALNTSKWNYATMFGAGFAATAMDPIEGAVGLLSGGLSTSRAFLGVGSKIANKGVRTAFRGAYFGGVESVALEPFYHLTSAYNKEQYSLSDSAMNLAFGAGLGATFAGVRVLKGDYDNIVEASRETVGKELNRNLNRIASGKKDSNISPLSEDYNTILSVPENKQAVESIYNEKLKRNPDATDEQKINLMEESKYEVYKNVKRNLETPPASTKDMEPSIREEEATVPRNDDEIDALNSEQLKDADDESQALGIDEELRLQREKPTEEPTEKSVVDQVEEGKQLEEIDTRSEAIKATVDNLFPAVKTVDVRDGLPPELVGKVEGKPGFVYKGVYYFDPRKLDTPEKMVSNILHESLGHIGIRAFLSNPVEFGKYIEYIDKHYTKEVDDWISEYGVKKRKEAAEELGAEIAERGVIAPDLFEVLRKKAELFFKKSVKREINAFDDLIIRESLFQGLRRVKQNRLTSYLNSIVDIDQLNDEYMKAVNNQDWNKVRLLVNEAARAAGYDFGIVYHGSGAGPIEDWRFKKEFLGQRTGAPSSKLGFFFASDKQTADSYNLKSGDMVRKVSNYKPQPVNIVGEGGKTYSLFLKSENPKIIIEPTPGKRAESYYKRIKQAWDEGHDMVIIKDTSDEYIKYEGGTSQRLTDVYVTRDPNQSKLSDLVTYDDDGSIIPLNKRFDVNKDDLRFKRDDYTAEKSKYAKDAVNKEQKVRKKLAGMDSKSIQAVEDFKNDYAIGGDLKTYEKVIAAKNKVSKVKLYDFFAGSPEDEWGQKILDTVELHVPQRIKNVVREHVLKFSKELEINGLEKFGKVRDNFIEYYKAAKLASNKANNPGYKPRPDEIPTASGQAFYDAVSKTSKSLINRINRTGARMQFLEDHAVKQVHDAEKIAKASGVKRKRYDYKKLQYYSDPKDKAQAFSYWRNKLNELGLDEQRMGLSGENLEQYLVDVFDGIWDGKKGETSGGKPSTSIKKLEAKRNIHFKTGEGAFSYNVEFGVEDTMAAIFNQIEDLSRKSVLMEVFGPSYKSNLEQVIDALIETSTIGDAAIKDRLNKTKKIVDTSLGLIDGSAKETDNLTLTKVMNTVRILSNVARMGGLLLTSQSDIALTKSALTRFNIKGQKINDSFGIYRFKNEAEKVALNYNAAMLDGIMGSVASRLNPDDYNTQSVMAKLQHGFFTVNGMNWWNKHIREAMQLGMMRRLGVAGNYSKSQLIDLGDDSKQLIQMLDHYGIDDAEWDLIRNTRKKIDKTSGVSYQANQGEMDDVYLMIDGIDDISDSQIESWLKSKGRKNISASNILSEKNKLKDKFGAFMLSEMDRGVLTPGVREWRIMNMGTKEGSWQNTFLKMLFQYKSYPLAMVTKVLVPSWKDGNFGTTMAFAAYAAAISVMVQQAKDVATGKTARPWGDPQLWMDGFARSGGLSFAWDLISKDWTDSGKDAGIGSFLGGPGLDLSSDVLGLVQQTGKAPFTEDGWKNLGKRTTNFMRDWTPAANIPIIQQLYRAMVIHPAMGMFDEDSLARSEKWIKRELDQEYWYGSPTGNNISPDMEDILFKILKSND